MTGMCFELIVLIGAKLEKLDTWSLECCQPLRYIRRGMSYFGRDAFHINVIILAFAMLGMKLSQDIDIANYDSVDDDFNLS